MRLTVFTDYALRVLMYLAVNPEQRVTIRDVAEGYGISRNHLMKVVNKLTRAELVDASRGVNGGLRLARAPEEITIGEVVRKTEDEIALVECFRADNQCIITPECALKDVFGEAQTAFLDVLDSYTLADLMAPRSRL
ncbi:MAG: Rrf2 family transcriptional regulator, partial [Gammaproteobacteria bacterium]